MVARLLSPGRDSNVLWRRKIAVDFIFSDVKHDDFVGPRHAMDVELHGLVGRLVFFLNRLVVGDDHQRVLEFLGIRLGQSNLDGADVGGGLGLGEVELKNIAFTLALQLIQFLLVARDQAALHAKIADRAGELGFGRLEVLFCRRDVTFRASEISADLADFCVGFLLGLPDLRREFLVAGLL